MIPIIIARSAPPAVHIAGGCLLPHINTDHYVARTLCLIASLVRPDDCTLPADFRFDRRGDFVGPRAG
ncbi:hypothetical protein D3C81_1805110 [compost metagenome]